MDQTRRLQKYVGRTGMNLEEAGMDMAAREKRQFPLNEKLAMCSFQVFNLGTEAELEEAVRNIWNRI